MAILTAKDAKIIGESITSPLKTIIPVKSLEEATIIAKQELALDKQAIKQEKDLLNVMKSLKDSIVELSNSVKGGIGIQKEFNENSTTLEQINNTQIEKGLLPPTYIAKLEAQAEKQEEIQGLKSQIAQDDIGIDTGTEGFKSDLFNTIKDGVMAPINAVKDGFNFFKDTLTEGANVAKDTYALGKKAFDFTKKMIPMNIKNFALKSKEFILDKAKFALSKKQFLIDKLSFLTNPFVLLATAIAGFILTIKTFGPDLYESIKETFSNMGQTILDNIDSFFTMIINAVIDLVNMIPGINIDRVQTSKEKEKTESQAKLSEGQNLVANAVASGAVGGDLRLGGESVIGGDVGSALIRDVKTQKDMVDSRMTRQADLFQQRAADMGMLPPVVVTNVNDNKQMNTQTNAVSVASGPVANSDDTVAKLLGAG